MIGNQFLNLLVGMQERTSKTVMELQNLRQAILLPDADFNTGAGVYSPSTPTFINNFYTGQGSLTSAETTADPWSGYGKAGRDWSGSVPADTWLALYIVSNGSTTPGNTYCVWSQSFQVPALAGLPGNPTVHCQVASNKTNSAGTAFDYQILKVDRRAYFVGGDATTPGALPLIASGAATKWTSVSTAAVMPPTGGPLGVSLRRINSGSYGVVGIAPNNTWQALPTLYLDDNSGADAANNGEILSDTGSNLAYWSDVAGGSLYATYFDDPQ